VRASHKKSRSVPADGPRPGSGWVRFDASDVSRPVTLTPPRAARWPLGPAKRRSV